MLKKNFNIEMCFLYPKVPEESRFMGCCGIVQRVKQRDDKVIIVDVKWEKEFVACVESELTKEVLKKSLWNLETPKKGAWR